MKFENKANPQRAVMASAVSLALLQMTSYASAQSAAQPEPQIQSVSVTGSLIRRAANEGATALTVIKATELEARGHTELKDLVLEQPQSLSLGTNTGAAGPVTNLRGLGPMRTLTLLNGRRLANEPLQDQYVSVNVIPRMALDRVETLSGGAASIYGADAIGGVQNYWTKRGYEGATIKAEYATPEMSGGGQTKSIGAIVGYGNLNKDGFNAYIAVDHQKKTALFQQRPPGAARPCVLRTLGLGLTPDRATPTRSPTSASPARPTRITTRPSPPAAARRTRCRCWATAAPNTPPVYAPGCFRNPLYWTAVTDGSEITTVSGRASWNLSGGHKVDLDLLHSEFTVQKFRGMQVPGATQPFTTYTLPSTSRFYPGKGITPGVQVVGSNTGSNTPVMFIDPTKTPGHGQHPEPEQPAALLPVGARRTGTGLSQRRTDQRPPGAVGRGRSAGLGLPRRRELRRLQARHPRRRRLHPVFESPGRLQQRHPEPVRPAGRGRRGLPAQHRGARLHLPPEQGLQPERRPDPDAQADDPAGRRPDAGRVGRTAARLGAHLQRAARLCAQERGRQLRIDAAGNVTQSDLVGETPQGVAKKLRRDIQSLVMEADVPLTSTFLLNGSVRADHYDDLKQTTVNPKLAARWQPLTAGAARLGVHGLPRAVDHGYPEPDAGSAHPARDGRSGAVPERPADRGRHRRAGGGYTADQVCNVLTTYWTKTPNNAFLEPEKSRGFSYGFAYEPVKNLTVTVDYWGLKLKNVLGALTIAEVQQNPAKYAEYIIRGRTA
jgi:iron complex outermembrane receptor protein